MASATTRPLACSLFGNGKIACGEPRGKVEVISLIECMDDITQHLKSCHLSRVKVMEYELILARAGIFHLPKDEIRKMTVCPKHRHNLGKYWRPLKRASILNIRSGRPRCIVKTLSTGRWPRRYRKCSVHLFQLGRVSYVFLSVDVIFSR